MALSVQQTVNPPNYQANQVNTYAESSVINLHKSRDNLFSALYLRRMNLFMNRYLTWLLLAAPMSCVTWANEVTNSSNETVYPIATTVKKDYGAHWLTPSDIRLSPQSAAINNKSRSASDNAEFYLAVIKHDHVQILTQLPSAKKSLGYNSIADSQTNSGGEQKSLDGITSEKWPHLADYIQLKTPISATKAKNYVKQPLAIVAVSDNKVTAISSVQTGNLLDALYTSANNDADELNDYGGIQIGDTTQFRLWAPTALSVNVLLFNEAKQPIKQPLQMVQDAHTGSWFVEASNIPKNVFYQYQITLYHPQSQKVETLTTTDPYSLSLSTNSIYSQVVDLNDKGTMPLGWLQQQDHPIKQPTDNIFYELHMGDFSSTDESVSKHNRGKYAAFSESSSNGINHLKLLKNAGINTIHLLPTFDIGTVNEQPNKAVTLNHTIAQICSNFSKLSLCASASANNIADKKQTLADMLKTLDPNSIEAQGIVSELRAVDNYNWGYDPFHYTVPEGSYASHPDGISRIKEFRQMVMSIHNLGFRVVMDVVYNHTHQAGLSATSVLDKIVPQYYHRLDPLTGEIAQSTCCDNTATERVMMGKLMVDSLKVWAKDYKIDGFRFDLMAHQPKKLMLEARDAVRKIDPDTYFYGEGWNFGEVANNQRFIQASQLELAGSGIGTFTDRLRDAVRGGAFTATGNGIRKSQGIGNGLADFHNELNTNNALLKNDYLLKADQLRVGLVGNLASYTFETRIDKKQSGSEVPYGNQPSGYALIPSDTINYVSKHDNQTLWDNHQYRLPFNTSTADRIRFHQLSLSYAILAQGIPFIHMGSELLRSKSFLRDSYDYGDWFNRVDFSYQTNNYHVGLPPKAKDEQNWSTIKNVLKNNEKRDEVTSSDIINARDVFLDFIKIRMSSPLFRLATANEVSQQVTFLNTGSSQEAGLIAMKIKYNAKQSVDSEFQEIIVFFNASTSDKQFDYQSAAQFELHPVQQSSTDKLIKRANTNKNSFNIPRISTAVFVKKK